MPLWSNIRSGFSASPTAWSLGYAARVKVRVYAAKNLRFQIENTELCREKHLLYGPLEIDRGARGEVPPFC